MIDLLDSQAGVRPVSEVATQVADQRTIHNYGTPQEKTVTGKNHGRMERQVELSWRIEKLTIPELKALLVTIRNKSPTFSIISTRLAT